MGYNEHCLYQDCAGSCCNYYGDCPEWYSNSNSLYTECFYYYTTDTRTLLVASLVSLVGVGLLIVIMCLCYRHYQQQATLLSPHNDSAGGSSHQFQTHPSPFRANNSPSLGLGEGHLMHPPANGKVYPLPSHSAIYGIGSEDPNATI